MPEINKEPGRSPKGRTSAQGNVPGRSGNGQVNRPTPPGPPRLTSQASRPSAVSRISPIGFDPSEGIKILLYGMSGTGKTTIAGTFPAPILWIVCSGTTGADELRSIDDEEHRKSVRKVVLYDSSEMREITDHVRELEAQGDQATPYRTVVLDHASGFQDLILKEILGLDEIPVQKTWGMASRQQYGQLGVQFKQYLFPLLSCKANVVIIAQERRDNPRSSDDEDDEAPVAVESDVMVNTVGAGLTPTASKWLNHAVSYIGQTYKRDREEVRKIEVGNTVEEIRVRTGKVDYMLRTGPHSVYATKFRVPLGRPLPSSIHNPTYAKILAVIQGQPLTPPRTTTNATPRPRPAPTDPT
jgi:hypothetical protein